LQLALARGDWNLHALPLCCAVIPVSLLAVAIVFLVVASCLLLLAVTIVFAKSVAT
jgi:hypothetical protein